MKATRFLVAFILLSVATSAQQRDTIRVCTYNLLNFPDSTLAERATPIATVINAIQPDILVTQSMSGFTAAATLQFILSDLTGSRLVAAPLLDGPDSDNALLYDTSKVMLIAYYALETEFRYVHGFQLVTRSSGDTFRVLVCHLKAGDTQSDRDQRDREATVIRRHVDTLTTLARQNRGGDSLVIVAGDLNVYHGNEPAYSELLEKLTDPILAPRNWNTDTTLAYMYTQSPRIRQFGGGATGGLDDRFDFLLVTPAFRSRYVADSYTAFGNDGHHYNDSINQQPNLAVDSLTAQALHDASDHLPVYLDLVFGGPVSGVEEEPVLKSNEMDLTEKK